jgi:hypothetical protein
MKSSRSQKDTADLAAMTPIAMLHPPRQVEQVGHGYRAGLWIVTNKMVVVA